MSARFSRIGFLVLFVAATASSQTAAIRSGADGDARTLGSGWEFHMIDGLTPAFAARPELKAWRPAVVPGVVPTDLLRLGLIPDPFFRDNEKSLQWMGLSDWEYRTTLTLTNAEAARKHVELVFDGLDTFADVYVNDSPVLHANNMFRTWRVDVKAQVHEGANTLRVVLHSAVETMLPVVKALKVKMPTVGQIVPVSEEGVPTDPYVRKAPYSYGWDWGPRFVNEGIWRDVHLETWNDVRVEHLAIAEPHVQASVAALEAGAVVYADYESTVTLRLHGGRTGSASLPLATRQVHLVAGRNTVVMPFEVLHPALWWPNGYGSQPLYDFALDVVTAAGKTVQAVARTGLRSVELRREKDAIGRSFTFIVNGVPVFAKGADVIPFDSFSSRETPARHRQILEAARDAHMNMVREWGGGFYESDDFYDIADELGILVWQEFMFGGEQIAGGSAFRENVRAEAVDQVTRLRNHPSVALWCGNNEVETGWYHWGNRKEFKATLDRDQQEHVWQDYLLVMNDALKNVVTTLDAEVPYTPSSPHAEYDVLPDSQTDGDMHYWEVWANGVPVPVYNTITPRFMSEYGFQSFPSMATLGSFAKPEDLQLESPVMLAHQKNDGGNQRIERYMDAEYPHPKDFAAFVYVSQVQQAEAIRTAAEHLRSSRPRTMGSLYWQLNDVWPGPSWSSIDYFGRPKALQFYAKSFYADIAIAAYRHDGVVSTTLLNDTQRDVPATLERTVMDMRGAVISQTKTSVTLLAASVTTTVDASEANLAQGHDGSDIYVVLRLRDGRGVELFRRIVYLGAVKEEHLPKVTIQSAWSVSHGVPVVTLTSDTLARNVSLEFGEGVDAVVSDSFFDLLPGESRTVEVKSKAPVSELQGRLQVHDLESAFSPSQSRDGK